jgi:Replication initiator protein A
MDLAVQPYFKPSSKSLGSLGRDEMNLAEFPIALLTDRVPKDQTEAVYQDEIFDERSGLTLSRKLTITAGNYGLTTPVDDEIILALIQLTRQKNNFSNRKLEFCRHELIQLLGWSVGGAKYDRIEVALDRWTSVHLKYENAWRDNRTKTWTTVGFHIIDKYELNDTRTMGDQLDLLPSFIIWGEDIFESFQAGYLKPLDYDLCMGLRNSTAKRMYRFLDKRFHHKPDWLFDLRELAHEHIGLGRHYEGPAHLKRNLRPAIEELEQIGFLESLSDSERFRMEGNAWKIRLVQKSPAPPSLPAPDTNPALEPSRLVTELINRGVTKVTAAEMVQKHPAEYLEAKLDVFDWLAGKQDKKVAKNPAGYLVTSINDDYAVPKGFESKAEQLKKAEAKHARERAEAEERRRRHEADAQARREKELINGFWDGLSKEQKAEHETAAIAQASDDERETLAGGGPMKKFTLTFIRHTYARKLLQSQGKLPPAEA